MRKSEKLSPLWMVLLLAGISSANGAEPASGSRSQPMLQQNQPANTSQIKGVQSSQKLNSPSTRQLQSQAVKSQRMLSNKHQQSLTAQRRIMGGLNPAQRKQFNALARLASKVAAKPALKPQFNRNWRSFIQQLHKDNKNIDVQALQSAVLTDAYKGELATVQQSLNKVQSFNKRKKQLREEIRRARMHRRQMPKLPAVQRIYRPARIAGIQAKAQISTIAEMDQYLEILDKEYANESDMGQMLQMELQAAMQKQQQAMQTLSAIMKTMHETAKSVLRNLK